MKGALRLIVCLAFAITAATAAGCGDAKDNNDTSFDAGPPMQQDAGASTPDTQPAAQVVGGGGTLRGGAVRMDIQLGHTSSQAPVSGGTTTIENDSAIKR